MMKEHTLNLYRILFVCTLLLATTLLSAQTLLYSEDFNGCTLPAGWTSNLVGNQDAVWYVGLPQNTNSDGSTIDGTCMLIIDDDATGDNTAPWVLQVISPSFNGLNYENLELSVDIHFRNAEESSFKVKVFDGTTLHDVITYTGWENTTGDQFSEYVTLTSDLSFFASDQMSIVFEYDDVSSWTWWAAADNISVIGSGEGTNVLTESFNDCTASNWTTSAVDGNDVWQFGLVDNNSAWESNSMNGSCFAYFDDDDLGGDAAYSTARLMSPIIDGSQFANFRLDFDFIFRQEVDLEHMSVYLFDGNQFHLVEEYFEPVAGPQFLNYENRSLDLSPFRSEAMQVVFQYDDGNTWAWWVGIDNVKVVGSGTLNDLCTNAIPLTLNDTCVVGSNQTAIYSGSDPSCFDKNVGALWYQYQSGFTGIVKINTAANFNDLITIFEGDCNNMSTLDCNNRDEHGFTGETHYMNVTAGTDYLIRVNGIESRFGVSRGDVCISLEEVSAFPVLPANDICSSAIPLTIDASNCTIGTNINANFEGPEPTLNLKSRSDIWYVFSATASALEIKTAADFADVITVFSGNCTNLNEYAMNQFGQSLTLNDLVIGETYYIQVAGFFATVEGNVCMSVETMEDEVATNDLCPDATFVPVDGACVLGDNTFAAFEGPVPSCEIFPTANIWFEFTAPSSGGVQINTGATFPHVVAVYSGNCADLEEISCTQNPVYCGGYFPVYNLTPGQNYFVQIASAENEFGYLFGELCLRILDIESDQIFESLELSVNTHCISDGISVLEVLPYGGVGNYTLIGNETGDTLFTGASYFVILSDELGCEISLAGVVDCGEIPCVVGAQVSSTNISCYNDNSGQATVDLSGAGNGPITIEWSTGATTTGINNLMAGNYSVTVTDDSGCAENYDILIDQPSPLIATTTTTGETSNGNDGTATATPTGGVPPYNYLWNTGAGTSIITDLMPDSYSVSITDANGCTTFENVIVNSFACAIDLGISSTNVSCFGDTDGQATTVINNGVPPFSYSWSTGETTPTITDLAVGNYAVTIEDANGCPSIESVFIDQPTEIMGTLVSSSNILCNGTNTGSAEVAASGGTPPYTYFWPGGGTGTQQSNLPVGYQVVAFVDDNGCSGTIGFAIDEPLVLESNISNSQNVSCLGNDDGFATVFAQGGTIGYIYLWNDDLEQTTATASNLPPGNYTVTVTDINGCTSSSQVTITQPANALSLTVDNVVDEVGAMGNGSIQVTATGGSPGYTFEWTLNGVFFSNAEDLFNVSAGDYSLVVTDMSNCVVLAENVMVGSSVSLSDSDLESNISILPNPTNGNFTISLELDRARPVQVGIYDVLGRQLLVTDEELIREVVYPFDMVGYASGVYAVRIYLDGEVVVRKVVVQGR